MSFLEFIDDMPCKQKKEFKKEFASKFEKIQIIHEQEHDKKFIAVDMYKVLIVSAKKYVP